MSLSPQATLKIARRAAVQRRAARVGTLARLQDSPASRRPANGDFRAVDRRQRELDQLGREFARIVGAAVRRAGGTVGDVERVTVAATATRPRAMRWFLGQ